MASLSGVRVNLFNENFLNESEQDANSVLTELDKGLRSSKLGIQCEAIVRFPRLFEKYPFPILINSSFLKLAEFFWSGSNLLRFWVLRVCQQSENHLDKILNIDAFVKRIFMVIHANDPVARALTLRTLGAVSRVITEKQQVHHAIRRALDSHSAVEVEAAIYASSQFASQSRSFAISMCAKISDMIESLRVPLAMKLQLIPVLSYMHHDTNTALLVNDLCLSLLPKYPAESFVVAILESLTLLSYSTLTNVSDQLNFLLGFLEDARNAVRAQALQCLLILAEDKCVHVWSSLTIMQLIKLARKCNEPREQLYYLKIIHKLSKCKLTCHILLHEVQSDIGILCTTSVCLNEFATVSQALSIASTLIMYCKGNKKLSAGFMEIFNLHMEGLLYCTIGEIDNSRHLRNILICGIQVAGVNPEFGSKLLNMITEMLGDDIDLPVENVEMMCEALGSLVAQFQIRKFNEGTQPVVPEPMETDNLKIPEWKSFMTDRLPLLLYKLNSLVQKKPSADQCHLVEILCALTLQAMIGCFIPLNAIDCFEKCCKMTTFWTQYRVARSASRYGQHFLASQIFHEIARNTVIDKLHFFIVGLLQMSQAECILNYGLKYSDMRQNYNVYDPTFAQPYCEATATTDLKIMPLLQRLENSINLYCQALTSLCASSSTSNAFVFQIEYLKLRIQFLQTLHLGATIKTAQIIVPPPAIAGSLAQSSRDYLQKFGHVTQQLRKLVKGLRTCEESYSRLFKSAFDADPMTLEYLEIAEYQCALFAHIVETMCFPNPSEKPTFLNKGKFPETRYFSAACRKIEALKNELPNEPPNNKTIGNDHLEVVMAIIDLVTRTPICVPRYFYQPLQSTQIKLSVSPQPRSSGEPVIVQYGSNLVIKVEGVIQHYGKKHSLLRSMEAVQLNLTSQLVTQRQNNDSASKLGNELVVLSQTVKPQRDFLSGSFLLPISSGGQWQVLLETYVIDDSAITWCTGPKHSMIVRVLEDPTKSSTTSSSSNQTRRF